MSPPCVGVMFDGDNGGETSRGVSTAEIRVGVPVGSWFPSYARARLTIDALFEHFNSRYELYGRRLVPVYLVGDSSSAERARSLGAEVAAQNVFASITGVQEYNTAQFALPKELARQGIVTVVRGASTWWSDRGLYDADHPFVWSVSPSAEDMQANLADFACTSLAGKPAAHAGDTALRQSARHFGIVSYAQQTAAPTSSLRDAVANCSGASVPVVEATSANGGSAALRAGLQRLRADGVTTVFCICEAGSASSAGSTAHGDGFHPEWVLTPTYLASGNDENWLQSSRRDGSFAPPIRLSPGPKLLPIQARPWFGALQAVGLFNGDNTQIYEILGMAEAVYPSLLVLASGIQGAGPLLTPETFAAGLMAMQFPNPGAGAAPYWQPSAGFGPGDHSLYDDYNVAWWSDEAPALESGLSAYPTGSWCYLGLGARFRVGTYPADAERSLFNPATGCR